MKKSVFDSLFLVNLVFPLRIFCVFEIYHIRIYTVEKLGLGTVPDDVRFIPNLSFNAEKLVFHSFLEP